jgi:uncharacterized membrane protein YgcG
MFNEFGVGTAEENRGMLFVFAINDREYALEIGDGFEKGSILRKDLETDFITTDMKNLLRAGNYDSVVRQVAEHLAKIMSDEENGIYVQKEADAVLKAEEAAKAKAEADEKMHNFFTIVAILLCAGWGVVGIVFFIQWLYKKYKCKKTIDEMMKKYAKHIELLKADVNAVCQRIANDISDEIAEPDPEYIADAFPRLLCRYYVEEQKQIIRAQAEQGLLENPINLYELALSGANQADTFSKHKVFDAETIIRDIDEEERQKAEMRERNNKTIEDFLATNMCYVSDKELESKILSRFTNKRSIGNRLVTTQELEEHFEKSLKELGFEMEFERFCEEHKDEIDGKYFDKQKFYDSLLKENNYTQYRYHANRTYNNMWMMHFLMLHMATQKNDCERREREEQEARERHRREEAARRQRQQMQSYNSSFGTGFGGGHSSGGGFKGGW